ncbi:MULTISPECIES: hypothetical protein [unclassified Streptomyces]|uniref:hypothetical protein n=1 Tax=unclassified Streptomyces TaxID=2593676 RepID=UPI00225456E5|nr:MULTISPECIES: hypothetical protein [unclassified Streptomyces]MCX4871102.1 hypothetical protein [Streptomyces sp. NBC_00906]MCX4902724.1 hypothetical protein [Streptomyces sp. NBC_00892]
MDYIRVVKTATTRGALDLVAVERAANGDRPDVMTDLELKEAARILVDRGFLVKEISDRLRVGPVRLAIWCPELAPKRLPAPKCGTVRGYRLHHRNGEKACTPCRTANSAVDRARRTFQPIPEALVA